MQYLYNTMSVFATDFVNGPDFNKFFQYLNAYFLNYTNIYINIYQ